MRQARTSSIIVKSIVCLPRDPRVWLLVTVVSVHESFSTPPPRPHVYQRRVWCAQCRRLRRFCFPLLVFARAAAAAHATPDSSATTTIIEYRFTVRSPPFPTPPRPHLVLGTEKSDLLSSPRFLFLTTLPFLFFDP